MLIFTIKINKYAHIYYKKSEIYENQPDSSVV